MTKSVDQALPCCRCGQPAVAFAPGQDAVREVGILLQRAVASRGTCLRCLVRPAVISVGKHGRTHEREQPADTDAARHRRRPDTVQAAALRDWETLQTAAAFQVEEQIRFVQWWTHAISVRESAGSNQWSSQDHGTTMEQAEQETRISNQRVARWRKSLGMTPESTVPDPIKQQDYFDAIIHEARKAAGWDDNHLAFNAGNDEWCTPQHWIDLARDAMGGIDLDPATNAGAQTRIQADRY